MALEDTCAMYISSRFSEITSQRHEGEAVDSNAKI